MQEAERATELQAVQLWPPGTSKKPRTRIGRLDSSTRDGTEDPRVPRTPTTRAPPLHFYEVQTVHLHDVLPVI